jgi:hypothetical protein
MNYRAAVQVQVRVKFPAGSHHRLRFSDQRLVHAAAIRRAAWTAMLAHLPLDIQAAFDDSHVPSGLLRMA